MPAAGRELLLCAGLQSSGSTLASWCFLQRADTDGVLDARFDMLPAVPRMAAPRPWVKFTIACFGFTEVRAHFEDAGWRVTPLLVVRDVRAVFNSLVTKSYGRNGTTADDPPIRLRLRRFQQDWRRFADAGWPVMRFESLVTEGEPVLRRACQAMRLPWDDGMVRWPKGLPAIAAGGYGNETFIRTRKASLAGSVTPGSLAVRTDRTPAADLDWMEREFADFNRAFDYPAHVPPTPGAGDGTATPTFAATRRYARLARRRPPLARLLRRLRGASPLSPAEEAEATGIPSPVGPATDD